MWLVQKNFQATLEKNQQEVETNLGVPAARTHLNLVLSSKCSAGTTFLLSTRHPRAHTSAIKPQRQVIGHAWPLCGFSIVHTDS